MLSLSLCSTGPIKVIPGWRSPISQALCQQRFVGRAYLPNGFDDLVHAGQRTGGTLGGYVPPLVVGYATGNLVSEYSPELKWLARKLHLPFIPK